MYQDAFKGIAGVKFPPVLDPVYEPVVWLSCVQVPSERRDALLKAAFAAKIEMRPFFHSLSTLPPYESYAQHCPNSLELAATGINLPTSRAVDLQVVERVANVFRDVLG
jgi:perosamine synthetase